MNAHLLAFLAGFVGLLGGMLAYTRLQGLAPGWETWPAYLAGAVVGGVLGWLTRPRDRE